LLGLVLAYLGVRYGGARTYLLSNEQIHRLIGHTSALGDTNTLCIRPRHRSILRHHIYWRNTEESLGFPQLTMDQKDREEKGGLGSSQRRWWWLHTEGDMRN
jgi:hypothetical protein